MPVIPVNLGNPHASDIAVEDQLPMTGNAPRLDGQSTLALNDAQVAKLYEDRNVQLTQGGLISFSGTQLQFTENLYLEINSRVSGGAPVIIPLFAGSPTFTANVPTSGSMIYVVINRLLGTATLTDAATFLPAVNASNQEVFMIGKRDDALDGTKRFYFREGTAINAGQTIRLGAPSGIAIPAGLIEMFGGTTPPPGYLICDGTTYLVATYPDLAAALFDPVTLTYAYGNPAATDATYTGTIAGTSTPVTLNAVTFGTVGNSINLIFNDAITAESLTFNATVPSTTNADWWSQGFTTTASGVVQSVDLELSYSGVAPVGNLTCQIYTSSGGTPGALLATSNPVDSGTLTNLPASYPFTFAVGFSTDLLDATQYCLVLNTSGVTYGLTSILVSIDNTGPYVGGQLAESTNSGGSWTLDPGNSAYFIVNTAPSINDEIAIWNAANPSNQVTLFSGDGTQVPSNGANAQLSGGHNSGDQFNVPDFRGNFARGWDNGAGNDPDAAGRTAAKPGGNTGDHIGSYEVDGQSQHSHQVTLHGNPGLVGIGAFATPLANGTTGGINSIAGVTEVTSENRPKNLNVNFIIKF